ncbi:hypothetical protein M2262_002411 [Pseudomonas sp. BIGb0408]|uniref:Arc-like DNA binding domain-containing protein n=1 Tax=Phytopseudomonas flavescens TaxID=29435 RepID=A0A7Y9XN52_9GAMM|nr:MULTISPECIES: Arc family DNA-binding protein [Pseudomonas]MCW2292361.1 hypothetical protein [Pseudomonas sp. BIGb0408]NYH73067.1 hypothetical protein [Pseudomonas flavescens]
MAARKYPSGLKDKFVVRMPDGMRAKVAQLAGDSEMSMNGEIVAAIEAHLENHARQNLLIDALQAQQIQSQPEQPKPNIKPTAEDLDYLDGLKNTKR